jgi:radical SAM superfamily enzyme YgiQ (UPF0313 family)
MKICLINPPRFHELVGKNPGIIEENRGYNPPLGLLSVATSLRSFTSGTHEIQVIDCQPRQLSYNWLAEYFTEHQFDVVGISAMTFTLIDVVMTSDVIKANQPDCKVVIGGVHTHIFPQETASLPNVDYIIQGEGEFSFVEFIEALGSKRTLHEVSGLAYEKNGQFINNGISSKIENLDSIPCPDRTLVPLEHYSSLLGHEKNITTMFTSRGCPNKCAFCDRPNSPIISGFRWRSANNVVDEMEACAALGINEILIYDDTFSIRKDRVFEICEEILTRNLQMTWDVRAHVNTVNRKMLQIMKKAGCDRIHYGVESGNDRMLKVIRKNTTVSRIKEAFDDTQKAGIDALAYFMIGLPEEKESDIQDVLDLATELKPEYCHFTIFCPYPNTAFYERGLSSGVIARDVWRDFARDPQPGFTLPVWEENFSREELQQFLVKLYKKFYLRPRYILKRVARIKSFSELKRKAKAGLSVLQLKASQVSKIDFSKVEKMK